MDVKEEVLTTKDTEKDPPSFGNFGATRKRIGKTRGCNPLLGERVMVRERWIPACVSVAELFSLSFRPKSRALSGEISLITTRFLDYVLRTSLEMTKSSVVPHSPARE